MTKKDIGKNIARDIKFEFLFLFKLLIYIGNKRYHSHKKKFLINTYSICRNKNTVNKKIIQITSDEIQIQIVKGIKLQEMCERC